MSQTKRSRLYLEQHWIPRLQDHAPILDLGKRDYTAHYRKLSGAPRSYVCVDIDPSVGPDLVADVCADDFVALARALHPAYGAILCNGVLGYGVDSDAQLCACMRNLATVLREGGQLLIGWNEWDIERARLCEVLELLGLHNEPIEGQIVHEPPETPGYEYLRHFYTCWRR